MNDLLVTFDPEDNWRPAPKKVIAQFNAEDNDYEMNYKPVTFSHTIISKTYKGKVLYVSPNANAFGKGTSDDPLDLGSAVAYCQPGQKIILKAGTYYPGKSLEIERVPTYFGHACRNVQRGKADTACKGVGHYTIKFLWQSYGFKAGAAFEGIAV